LNGTDQTPPTERDWLFIIVRGEMYTDFASLNGTDLTPPTESDWLFIIVRGEMYKKQIENLNQSKRQSKNLQTHSISVISIPNPDRNSDVALSSQGSGAQ